jgi:hypothetical protein
MTIVAGRYYGCGACSDPWTQVKNVLHYYPWQWMLANEQVRCAQLRISFPDCDGIFTVQN